jgi:hypothetical protein
VTKKPGVAFWATVVVVVVLIGYPLSFGPACWLTSQLPGPTGFTQPPPRGMCIYGPFVRHIDPTTPTGRANLWWIRLGMPKGTLVKVPVADGVFIVTNG